MPYVKAQLSVPQIEDANGDPASGYTISSYIWDTSTPTPMYTSSAGAGSATSFTLNSLGEPQTAGGTACDIFLDSAIVYKFIIRDAGGVQVGPTIGPVYAGNASGSTVIAAVTGATALALDEFMAVNLSLLNFGVTTASTTAAITTALQTAIDAASAAKVGLKIPGGTWILTPATTKTWEGAGNMLCAAIMKSNMFLYGEADSVLKIANGVSSDGSPTQMAMFFTNEQLTNIRMERLTLDMNGANNLISPNRGSSTYNRYNQAHIHVTGTPSGNAARVDGAVIFKCKFINTPGVTCIGMQQTNTSGLTLSSNWRIEDCDFENNGIDTDDHSSIFGWAEKVWIVNNRAKNSTMYNGTGANVFYECHGAEQVISGNIVENYNQFSWCATNNTSDTQNVIYSNNVAKVRENGTAFYRLTTSTGLIRKIKIHDEIYNLTDDATAAPLKYGVLLSGGFADGEVTDVEISNVLTTKVGTSYPSAAIGIGSAANIASQKHTRIKVRDCTSQGTNFGVLINTNATNGLGVIEVVGGNYQTAPTATYTNGIGVYVNLSGTNTIDRLTLGEIDFDGTNNGMHRGIYLEQGTISNLNLRQCSYQGMITENYTEGSVTITNRRGTYPTLSYTPTWSSGSAITVGNGSVAGRYTKIGDICYVTAELNVGTTTTFPGGTLSVTLPIAAATSGIKYIGECLVIDGGTTRHQGQAVIDGAGSSAVLEQSGGTFFTNTSPITLASTDELYVCITYRVAD